MRSSVRRVLVGVMLVVVLALSAATAFAAKPAPQPAPSGTNLFKLVAERKLASTEDPAAAVADATKKIMAYIDKNGGSYKVVPNGNAPDGRSLKMPSPGAGQFIQIIEIYSASVDGCMLSTEGGRFSVALPWEYAIYTDGSGKISVNMLVPSGVVALMASDPACLAPTAKSVEDNMTKWATTALGRTWTAVNKYQQPILSSTQVAQARTMSYAPQVAIPVPYGVSPAVYTQTIRDSVTNAINAQTPVLPQGWHVSRAVDFGGSAVYNMYSLELCSPYYASQALGMGPHHAPALPCQIGVWNEGGYVMVSILDPNFIFAWFFGDAVAQMTPEQQQMFAQLPVQVMTEIKTMTNTGLAPHTSARF